METYNVTGSQPVLGHEPGEKFQANIPADQEARLIARGQIARASSPFEGPSGPGPDAPAVDPAGGNDEDVVVDVDEELDDDGDPR